MGEKVFNTQIVNYIFNGVNIIEKELLSALKCTKNSLYLQQVTKQVKQNKGMKEKGCL